MKILVFEFGGGVLNSFDIHAALRNKKISYQTVSYSFADTNHDEYFKYRFLKVLKEGLYDAVFSINYFPLVAECCFESGIKYLAWSFDNPLNATNVEETMGLETNHVFLFDRDLVKKYTSQGFDNVKHLPLAVNCDRLDTIRLTKDDERYISPVSFVGRLYDSQLPVLSGFVDEYLKGYLEAIETAQTDMYGVSVIHDMVTEELVAKINRFTNEEINRDWLIYELEKAVTRRERVLLIRMLSDRYPFKLYSVDQHPAFVNIEYMGTCNYVTEMPKVFKLSAINLNIALKTITSGIPQRIVDIMGAQGLCLTNFQPELLEHFENGRDIVFYDSMEDAIDKAQYLLTHEEDREAIRINGYNRMREAFSYEQRFEQMFESAGIHI